MFTFDPVFKEWAKTYTLSPNPYSFFLGYGFIGIFAAAFVWLNWKKKTKNQIFLISWIIAVLLLSYLPFKFNRRLILGFHIPLALLATLGIFQYVIPWLKNKIFLRKVNPALLMMSIFLLTIPTNIRYMYDDIYWTKKIPENYNLYDDDLEALKWIDKNIPSEETILASFTIGVYIPGWTGNKVYAGHYDQTVNSHEKLAKIRYFFGSNTPLSYRINLINESKAKYIYYGPFEKKIGNIDFDNMNFLEKIYQNKNVSVYKVIGCG
jgi:hypothetical protein